MATGSGTGTPIQPSGVTPTIIPDAWPNCAVSLARYAQLIGYDECAFWGVSYDEQKRFECSTYWTEWQRQNIAESLAQAQQMLEDMIGYPLCPTWITGTIGNDGRMVDQQAVVGNPITTKWGMVLQAGVRATAAIEAGSVIDYSVEPAVIGPITSSVTDAAEVKVYYPGSDRVITPSKITISGGAITIYVPKCRLLSPDYFASITADVGLAKTDTDNFTATVDVTRVYNDASVNAYLVRAHSCTELCSAEGCVLATDAACMVIRDPVLGIVRVHPATYASSAWTQTTTSYSYNHVRLNYQAGLRVLPRNVEAVIVRLAHSLMPEEPCGCAIAQRLWARDRKMSEVLTREMLNCPFGYMAGALFAYSWAMSNAQWKGAVI